MVCDVSAINLRFYANSKPPGGSAFLLQLPFEPAVQLIGDPDPPFSIRYHDVHHQEPKATTDVDISFPEPHFAELVKHRFSPKARPVRIDVNGRQGRRAICVLYAGGLRYEVLDLDAEMGDEDEEGEE